MNQTMTTQEVFAKITEDATFKARGEDRIVPEMKIGQYVRQGDIYITKVAANHPRGAATQDRQLAQGESRGSRHIAEAPAKIFAGSKAPSTAMNDKVFLGPCVESASDFRISHPEHAHVILTAGTYQITHQMDALTLKRVAD